MPWPASRSSVGVEVVDRDRDVAVAGAELVGVDAVVVGQLEARHVAVAGEVHEDVDRLVADRDAADLLEAERLVEGDRAVDVGDAVAGVDEGGHGAHDSVAAMILERSMNEQFLSNTYLVGDREGGTAAFIDAGGPVAPLLEAVDEHDLTPTHVLLTHHHYDHVCELDAILERYPDIAVLIHPLERELVEQATGTIEPGQTLKVGDLEIEALHTPGHTAGMISFVVDGNGLHRRHAVQELGRRRARAGPHDLRGPQATRSWTR